MRFSVHFIDEHRLKQHSSFSTSYTCDICIRESKTVLGLKTHFQNIHNSVHTEDQTIHKCEFCSAVLKTKENLRTHVKNVHEHSETQCGICFKRLLTQIHCQSFETVEKFKK